MAYTQTDLDRIRAAIASGELSVRFGERSVTYRSIRELRDAEAAISASVNTANDVIPVRRHQIVSSKGW